VRADPSLFGAQFQLGVLCLETGDLAGALRACETATVLEPKSQPARYNFALALKSAGYATDAGRQLQIVLQQDPNDTRSHLTLGNLYARQFGDPDRARVHYRRVLELDPGHPQAAAIHRWLAQNPL
jgi:Flp pilus assembly protein TadD